MARKVLTVRAKFNPDNVNMRFLALKEQNAALKAAVVALIEIVNVHEVDSFSCDNDGQMHCTCFEEQINVLKSLVNTQ
jgi:hypothetical protein